jgi:hypothetical protein
MEIPEADELPEEDWTKVRRLPCSLQHRHPVALTAGSLGSCRRSRRSQRRRRRWRCRPSRRLTASASTPPASRWSRRPEHARATRPGRPFGRK